MMDQQKRLFQLAKQLYEEKFWDEYLKSDLIAIQLGNRKEPIIISVLGENEQNYGFLFYRNVEDLATFFETNIGEKLQKFRPMLDIIPFQNCLSLEFENKKAISKEEHQLIEMSGVTFRGKKSYPIFVDYYPGYYPSIIDKLEIPLLIEVMEKLIETAKDFEEKLTFYKEKKTESEILIRTYQKNGEYIDGLLSLPERIVIGKPLLKETTPILLTKFEMRRVENQKFGSAIWEIDIDFVNSPIAPPDGERPYFPLVLLIVDSESNEIICSEFVKPGDSEAIQRVFMQLVLSGNKKPPKIVVDINQYNLVARYLKELLVCLEIELVPIRKLPMISVFKKNMLEYLR